MVSLMTVGFALLVMAVMSMVGPRIVASLMPMMALVTVAPCVVCHTHDGWPS